MKIGRGFLPACLLAACTSNDDLPRTAASDGGVEDVARVDGADGPAPHDADASPMPCDGPSFAGDPIGLSCGNLVDTQGRYVFFRGVNARVAGIFDVTFDDGRKPLEPIPAFDASDVQLLQEFGFDALRLPLNWSGIEPTQAGGFHDDYLDAVEKVVDLCASANIFVLLDFHQDAYSKEIGEDGMPLWAIYPPPSPSDLHGGPLTTDELAKDRMSLEVEEATATFFLDGLIGKDIRDRFLAMVSHVAQRFASKPNVIGIEIFNEPTAQMDGLLRLYRPGYDAVRAAMPNKLFFFEPDATRNVFDSAPPGSPIGDGVVYTPHFYKYAFTSTADSLKTFQPKSLEKQIANALPEARSWNAGLVSTEWGFDPKLDGADAYMNAELDLQDQYGVPSFFWVWKEESQGDWGCFDVDSSGNFTPRALVKKVFARVRPKAIAGVPASWTWNATTGTFDLTFTSDPNVPGPHLLAIPPALGQPLAITCDGATVSDATFAAGVLTLSCGERDGASHTIHVEVAPP